MGGTPAEGKHASVDQAKISVDGTTAQGMITSTTLKGAEFSAVGYPQQGKAASADFVDADSYELPGSTSPTDKVSITLTDEILTITAYNDSNPKDVQIIALFVGPNETGVSKWVGVGTITKWIS